MTDRLVDAVKAGVIVPGDIWVGHAEFPLYMFSIDGRVLSLVKKRPKVLSPGRRGCYDGFTLLDASGSLRSVYRHILIAESFHGPRPQGMECRHLDGNKQNSSARNLAWGTPKDNAADKIAHGTTSGGEANGMAVLTMNDVVRMRSIRDETGRSYSSIAAQFGVSAMTAYRAITRQSWR